MNGKNDHIDFDELLSGRGLRENPFRTPEGYFDALPGRLSSLIEEEEASADKSRPNPVWRIIKPALTLAAMFALVFGMGYGVLSLTHTLDRGASSSEVSGYASAEEELLLRSSLLNYYQNGDQDEEQPELGDDTIADYLATGLSYTALAEIYAQLY
ncbi:MAG: hypothetical protein K6G79_09050 [Bacteroidales bacterium]|nr:hypothetical protein [Bacteroidales bacterium]